MAQVPRQSGPGRPVPATRGGQGLARVGLPATTLPLILNGRTSTQPEARGKASHHHSALGGAPPLGAPLPTYRAPSKSERPGGKGPFRQKKHRCSLKEAAHANAAARLVNHNQEVEAGLPMPPPAVHLARRPVGQGEYL